MCVCTSSSSSSYSRSKYEYCIGVEEKSKNIVVSLGAGHRREERKTAMLNFGEIGCQSCNS